MLPTNPWRARARWYLRDLNWLPRSECTLQPLTFPRMRTALSKALTARSAFILGPMEYPTIRPENASLIAQR